jgi:nitrate/TMAO reductase-like tetraheme cytochrome c subunit
MPPEQGAKPTEPTPPDARAVNTQDKADCLKGVQHEQSTRATFLPATAAVLPDLADPWNLA